MSTLLHLFTPPTLSSHLSRGENHLPGWAGAVEVHAGNSGEAEGLSGPVRVHGAAEAHRAALHARDLLGERGASLSQTYSNPRETIRTIRLI